MNVGPRARTLARAVRLLPGRDGSRRDSRPADERRRRAPCEYAVRSSSRRWRTRPAHEREVLLAAHGSLVLDAQELHHEASLFQRNYDRAVAAVPAAMARRVEAQGDYLVKASTATLLEGSARVT